MKQLSSEVFNSKTLEKLNEINVISDEKVERIYRLDKKVDKLQIVAKLFIEGYNSREISEKLNVNKKNVQYLSSSYGLKKIADKEYHLTYLTKKQKIQKLLEKFNDKIINYDDVKNILQGDGRAYSNIRKDLDLNIRKHNREIIINTLKKTKSIVLTAKNLKIEYTKLYGFVKNNPLILKGTGIKLKTRLSKEETIKRNMKLIKDHENGKTMNFILKKYGIKEMYYYNIISEYNIKNNNRKVVSKKTNIKRNKQIIKQYLNGKTYEELAEKHNLNMNYIIQIVTKNKIK